MLSKFLNRKKPQPKVDPEKVITVVYENWEGKVDRRRIIPQRLEYGVNQWHPRPQWLLHCYDVDKKANRSFALERCSFVEPGTL